MLMLERPLSHYWTSPLKKDTDKFNTAAILDFKMADKKNLLQSFKTIKL